MPAITIETLTAIVAAGTPEQKRALREAMRVGTTPEQAAASEAYVTRGYACTATPPCGRTGFRTAKRAASHDVAVDGHVAAK